MGKINLFILCLLCSSTTARNVPTVQPDITPKTIVPIKKYPIDQGRDYSNLEYDSGYGNDSGHRAGYGAGSGGYGPGYGYGWGPMASATEAPSAVVNLMIQLEKMTERQLTLMQDQLKLIQQMSEQISQPTEPPRTEPPETGYTTYPYIGYYKFHKELLTWDVAKEFCKKEKAHLAVINSQEEAHVLVKIFASSRKSAPSKAASKDYIYLGFHDQVTEGVYLTVNGYLLEESGYTRWEPGQPDNGGRYVSDEDCGAMHKSGLLNDIHCTSFKVPFICEKDYRIRHG